MKKFYKVGYVYFLKDTDNDLIKIGKTSRKLDKRLYEHSRDFNYELVQVIYSVNCSKTERLLHSYYQDKMVEREKFNLSKQDIEDIRKLAFSDEIRDSLINTDSIENSSLEIVKTLLPILKSIRTCFDILFKKNELQQLKNRELNLKIESLEYRKNETIKHILISEKSIMETLNILLEKIYTLELKNRELDIKIKSVEYSSKRSIETINRILNGKDDILEILKINDKRNNLIKVKPNLINRVFSNNKDI
ncbi:GIY-YIG nuclease family protein [Bacillus salitolerans]|uniref:GIY-YIG nuclease family protein n=1 Tax=Bacillus salitolerans TaxID=1437434 RepID=A0ABW4LMB1_9BACI